MMFLHLEVDTRSHTSFPWNWFNSYCIENIQSSSLRDSSMEDGSLIYLIPMRFKSFWKDYSVFIGSSLLPKKSSYGCEDLYFNWWLGSWLITSFVSLDNSCPWSSILPEHLFYRELVTYVFSLYDVDIHFSTIWIFVSYSARFDVSKPIYFLLNLTVVDSSITKVLVLYAL